MISPGFEPACLRSQASRVRDPNHYAMKARCNLVDNTSMKYHASFTKACIDFTEQTVYTKKRSHFVRYRLFHVTFY